MDDCRGWKDGNWNEDGFTVNGKKFVRMMENDDNIITEYILDRRLNHYWKKGQSGINHFNHLRSVSLENEYIAAADELMAKISFDDNLLPVRRKKGKTWWFACREGFFDHSESNNPRRKAEIQ